MEEIKSIGIGKPITDSAAITGDPLWSAWEIFQRVTGYEHENLTDVEQQEAKTMRSRKNLDYSVPVFMVGLKTKYHPQVIVNFFFKRFEINIFVDSIRRRLANDGSENTYDVNLWVDERDYFKVLLWEEILSDLVARKLAICHISSGIMDYRYSLFVKRQIKHGRVVSGPLGASIDALMQNYCETLGLAEPVG